MKTDYNTIVSSTLLSTYPRNMWKEVGYKHSRVLLWKHLTGVTPRRQVISHTAGTQGWTAIIYYTESTMKPNKEL